jgi:PadR family transcriptional regulator, regulatory protein PadR
MRIEDKLLEGNLATVLMAILADGASYGYAIVAEAERRTNGRLKIKQNALYPALHKLEAAGLIEGEWREAAGRRRRYYELTTKGRVDYERRRARWREFAETMEAALGTGSVTAGFGIHATSRDGACPHVFCN